MLVLWLGRESYWGYVWECQGNGVMDPDLGDELGDHFGDEMWDPKNAGIFSISLLGAEIRIYPDDSMWRHGCREDFKRTVLGSQRVVVCRSTLNVLIDWDRLWSANVFGVLSAVRASKLLEAEWY
ncbi:hypothetical protein AVEN_226491-1 [Araneus ventricosus]|uniref:Uncharacterized protein n=1 Tax=Araneus ventricosus TaxID=182803 RepID=A0A4Y2E4R0_ARAVE|nr:hypothetical protein AVEN_226491-1 [Araneus ventricosus]